MDSKVLLKWDVTTTRYNLASSGQKNLRFVVLFLIIFLAAILGAAPSASVESNSIKNSIVVGFFVVGMALWVYIYMYFMKNSQVTYEYVITEEGVNKRPSGRQKILKSIGRLAADITTARYQLAGYGSVFNRPFKSVSHYKVSDGKIVLVSKSLRERMILELREFVIVPSNNMAEIISILDKYIPKT